MESTSATIPVKNVGDVLDLTNVNLDRICQLEGASHFEITGAILNEGDTNSGVHVNQIHKDSYDQRPNSLKKAWRVIVRSPTEQQAYRQGIENVRNLLRQKYDQNAVERFDNHFSYRRWAGKPLTVGALQIFIAKENQLRQGSVNISTLEQSAKTLEDLKRDLSAEKNKQENRIIGGSKVSSADKTDYAFPLLPMARSWFEFSANAEDLKKGREVSIKESRKVILGLIEDKATQKHVEHLFNCCFAEKIEKKEPLTVKELAAFIDDAIKMKDDENKILGGLYSAVTAAKQGQEDIVIAATKFLKEAYHAIGVAAGAAIVLDQERNTNDPIMGLIKGIGAGTVVASENDTQRILTAIGLHFIATPAVAAPRTSITSRVLKFFTFGLY